MVSRHVPVRNHAGKRSPIRTSTFVCLPAGRTAYRPECTVDALSRGLRGWVRNEADGSVSALLIGSEEAVAGMVRALHEGPPAAQVHHVEVLAAELPEKPVGFEVRY